MCVLARTHCLDWSGFIPLRTPTSWRTPQVDESWVQEEEAPALPANPSLPIFPFCIICFLDFGGRETKAGGSRPTAGTFSSLASNSDYLNGKQRSAKLSPLKCPGHVVQVTNTTGYHWASCTVGADTWGAGFSSFWKVSPGIPAGMKHGCVLSLTQVGQESPFLGMGCLNPKQRDGSSPKATSPSVLHRDHMRPCAALGFLRCSWLSGSVWSFPQTNRKMQHCYKKQK